MSDVRSLLKAKRQEIRIDHPLASYTSSGQLRCVVCETNIKHPSAWDGHLGSKAHRTNAARVREEERRRKEQEQAEEAMGLKRKIPEDDDTDEDRASATKKLKVAAVPLSLTSTLPSDFFSDPSRAPVPSFGDSEDEDEMDERPAVPMKITSEGDSSLDQEWIQFQQTVVNAPDAVTTYHRATIIAEPELVLDSSEGLPTHEVADLTLSTAKVDEEKRRRKEQEERELIMDRLMDEERAQEEADMKVIVMKNRLEALRKRREASRSAKSNVGIV